MNQPQYLTVSALTKYIKAKLEGDKHLFSILLKGEVSNFKKHSRGHLYFTLKDEGAQISAIMFARDAEKIGFSLKDGDHVLVSGRISLYEPSGSYSIQVSQMKLDGIGELYLKYEALKKELEEKGYFRLERKKPIPKFPKVIGVVTSSTGAVIEDIKHTVTRRYLLAEVHLYPALVQGPDSASSIRNQILYANQLGVADVLIVGRGGGSIEDLWGFNEMPVIDAIYHSTIPIITAIGHETDFTLSDFVSDLRAPTPTAAAELATPNANDLMKQLEEWEDSMHYRLSSVFQQKKTELLYLDERLERISPQKKVQELHEALKRYDESLLRNFGYQVDIKKRWIESLKDRLKSPIEKIYAGKEKQEQLTIRLDREINNLWMYKTNRFDVVREKLQALNPLHVMDKGFALIEKDHQVITSVKTLTKDEIIDLRLKDGKASARILDIEEDQ